MTAPDELERVWRVVEAIPAINDLSAQYQNDIAEAILSERAELLAAVEKMREIMSRLVALPVATRELVYLDKGIGTKTPEGVWLDARAALTTGEATNAGERG